MFGCQKNLRKNAKKIKNRIKMINYFYLLFQTYFTYFNLLI